jgi:hypothetical protein
MKQERLLQVDNLKYVVLTEVIGRWIADVIESFLKAEGIDVVLIEGTVSGLFTPTFGAVKIYVPKEDLKRSRELLTTFEQSQDGAKET